MLAVMACVATLMAASDPPVQVAHDVWVGPVPAAPTQVQQLKDAGIRTVISVDALPSPAMASFDVRRVHIPIGYDTVSQADLDALIVAWRDCPKPLYIHCHHGKHRAPAAAAALLRRLGRLDPQAGEAVLTRCGTSRSYPGLYRVVRTTTPISLAAFSALTVPLHAHQQAGTMAEAMANLDRVWKKVKATSQSHWQPPKTHPDAAPAADCAAVTEHLRHMRTMPYSEQPSWEKKLDQAIDAATRLEAAVQQQDHAMATAIVVWMDSSCTHCHAVFRDGIESPPSFVANPPWQQPALPVDGQGWEAPFVTYE